MTTAMLTFGVLDAVQLGQGNIVSASTSSGALPRTAPSRGARPKHTPWVICATANRRARCTSACRPAPRPIRRRWTRSTGGRCGPPTKWLRSTYTAARRRWAMSSSLYVLRPMEIVSEVWLGGLEATSATITVTDGPGGPTIFGPTTSPWTARACTTGGVLFGAGAAAESCYVVASPWPPTGGDHHAEQPRRHRAPGRHPDRALHRHRHDGLRR